MFSFILRRLIQFVFVMIVLTYVSFSLMALMPGDPVEMMIASNPKITSEDVARLREFYGLDQPSYVRFAHWAADAIKGDLGYSRTYRIPVTELMGERLMNSALLALSALVLSLAIAIPLGIFSALKPGGKLDAFANTLSFMGISIPSFWLGLMLIIVFAVLLGWFPAGGTESIGQNLSGWSYFKDRIIYMILPILSLSIQQIGRYVRFARSAMLEAMRNDYIRTAKAKGLSRRTVIWAHGFRNALIPLITVIALGFSGLFSGAVLTETVFSYQGVGKLAYDSIIANDYNVAMVSFIISVSMVLLFSLIADLLYSWVDPRIHLG